MGAKSDVQLTVVFVVRGLTVRSSLLLLVSWVEEPPYEAVIVCVPEVAGLAWAAVGV